jgi:uncharacterized protein (DUF2236 family)
MATVEHETSASSNGRGSAERAGAGNGRPRSGTNNGRPARPRTNAGSGRSTEGAAATSLLELIRRAGSAGTEPMEDYGWFGPDSVTWRVWSYPTALTVGFSRAVVVEELDPFLIAPVKSSSKIYSQARVRYDRTLRYFATYLFADSRSIVKASEVLCKVHAAAASPDPVSGLLSDPNNPDEQLWIHMTAWHSILYTYERFGPGSLSEADEAQFWRECAIAAEAQTIDPDKVPRSREQVREYFARMRPRLAASEATQEAMDHLMHPEVMFPPTPAALRPAAWLVAWFIRHGVIASMPHWQRDLGNVNHPQVLDVLVPPVLKGAFCAIHATSWVKLSMLGILSPLTVPVAGPMLRGIKPRREEVLTPEESFRRHGVPTPRELYDRLGHDQSEVRYTPSAPLSAEDAATWAV